MQKSKELEEYQGEEFVEKALEYLNSGKPNLQLLAVIWVARRRERDERLIAAMRGLANSEARILGMPLSEYTQAALHVLGAQEYTGDNWYILKLIQPGSILE